MVDSIADGAHAIVPPWKSFKSELYGVQDNADRNTCLDGWVVDDPAENVEFFCWGDFFRNNLLGLFVVGVHLILQVRKCVCCFSCVVKTAVPLKWEEGGINTALYLEIYMLR